MMIEIYTDGSCLRNPGPGGFAGVIFFNHLIYIVSGFAETTTNNQMELLGAIKSLECAANISNKFKYPIMIYTDSKYVKNGIEEWILTWQENSWRTSNRTEVKNKELWTELNGLNISLNPDWHWIKGHSGNVFNTIVDHIANFNARTLTKFNHNDLPSLTSKFPQLLNYEIHVC